MIYYIYNQDQIVGFIYNGITYYYHKNILGDIIGILNTNYQEIVKYTYDTYGNILSIVDNSNINLGELNPFRYRSYYYDTETQLYYLNSRYYNPATGRFINADGIICSNKNIISCNLYQYASNNFINSIDKTGKSSNFLEYSSPVIIFKKVADQIAKTVKPPAQFFLRSVFRKKGDPAPVLSQEDRYILTQAIRSNSGYNNAVRATVAAAQNAGSNYGYSEGHSEGGNFNERAIINKFDFTINAKKINYDTWMIETKISDTYNFDEKKKLNGDPVNVFLALSNNIALEMQNRGLVKPYDLEFTFLSFYSDNTLNPFD